MTLTDYKLEICYALDNCRVRDGRSHKDLRTMESLYCLSDPVSCRYCNSEKQGGK